MASNTDGVYVRGDRGGEYWITWTDAQGRRKRRRTLNPNNIQAAPSDLLAGHDLPPPFSEEGLALRFSLLHERHLRYVAVWGRWLYWDEKRWCKDDTLAVFDRARKVCRAASAECVESERDKAGATRIASKSTVAAVERLAQADLRHAATTQQWDSDPWLLNTPAGIVELRTGNIREHRPEDYMTKITRAEPGTGCPLWMKVLERITNGNLELQAFLQRLIGYCLTGSTREHAIFFLHGNGANGKSVFLNTVANVLGDYGKTAPASVFTSGSTEQHPTDLAGLMGARFVTAIETEEGRLWAEAKVKALTGGDRVTARFMRQDFFQFVPQFKLLIAGNHKPGLRNVDEAMRRRMHLIPFSVTVNEKERDPELTEKLRAEWPGILGWAIEGCLAWQQEGLNPPEVVRRATTEYLASEDSVGRWIEEYCIERPNCWAPVRDLFASFERCCKSAGESAGSKKRFTQTLESRGFRPTRTGYARGISGIALRSVTDVTHPEIIAGTRASLTGDNAKTVTTVTAPSKGGAVRPGKEQPEPPSTPTPAATYGNTLQTFRPAGPWRRPRDRPGGY
jgi:putative DNA primase/helicase